jgi:hypothetical protein
MTVLSTKIRHLEERKEGKSYFQFWIFDFGFWIRHRSKGSSSGDVWLLGWILIIWISIGNA